MIQTIYGVHNDNSVVFFSLEAAEDYCITNYPEHCGHKEAFVYFCENMIWEESLMECCFCGERDTEESLEKENIQMRSSNCGDYHYHTHCQL
jgi:hypothetical protein